MSRKPRRKMTTYELVSLIIQAVAAAATIIQAIRS